MTFKKSTQNMELIKVFQDTQEFISNSEYLKKSINDSIENTLISELNEGSLYEPSDWIEEEDKKPDEKITNISIKFTNERTLEAAHKYAKSGKKRVAVLNFASAKHPGGKVEKGSNAQEESLCRISTLYNVLSENEEAIEKYYSFNTKHIKEFPLYSDKLVYSPDIVVFRPDEKCPTEFLSENKWYKVDVITMPAPNLLRRLDMELLEYENLYRTYVDRIELMFKYAYLHHVDVLILGAWGCGVFRNPPQIVAEAFSDVCNRLGYLFDTIEFAIIDDNRGSGNLKTFSNIITDNVFCNFNKVNHVDNVYDLPEIIKNIKVF